MKEYPVFETLPEGWKYMKGATAHPRGYRWINNGKSLFSPEYRQALIKLNED